MCNYGSGWLGGFGKLAGRMLLLVVLAAVWVAPCVVLAAEGDRWPALTLDAKNWRGPGGYLSLTKVVISIVVFLLWVRTSDWISRDIAELKADYVRWNPLVFGPFMAAMVLLWLLPWFILGLLLLLAAYIGPLVAYFLLHRKRYAAERPDEALESLSNLFGLLAADGIFAVVFVVALAVNWAVISASGYELPGLLYLLLPVATVLVMPRIYERIEEPLSLRFLKWLGREKKAPHETGPPLVLLPRGGPTPRDENVRLLSARQAPGHLAAREALYAGLAKRASAIHWEYTQQGVAVRYLVDGVWLEQQPAEREKAELGLQNLKILCGLNPKDRQSRQQGKFSAAVQGTPLAATLTCQAVQGAERVIVQFEEKQTRFENLEALGMRPKMQEQVQKLLESEKGLIVFSALPDGGLHTTFTVALRNTDRLMREFAAVEDEANRYEEVENVPVTTYNSANGESPATVLPRVLRTDPNVVVVRDLVNAETAALLCREVAPQKLVLATVRAKDAAEALLRVASLGVPPKDLARVAVAVLYQRLIRKLCDACKQAYPPPPETLKQLGIPPGRVEAFYRPPQPQPGEKRKPCQQCGDVGYFGRTALFELLVVGENTRKVLASSPKLELLRAAARKDGMRTLQEEGILLVAKGTTSLQELMRVLKQ